MDAKLRISINFENSLCFGASERFCRKAYFFSGFEGTNPDFVSTVATGLTLEVERVLV